MKKQERMSETTNTVQESYKVFVDEEGFLTLHFLDALKGDDAVAQAVAIRDEIKELVKGDPKKEYDMIVNLPLSGSYLPGSARNAYSDIAEIPQIHDVAVIGDNSFFQLVVKMVVAGARMPGRMKYFQYRQDAVSWLKSGREDYDYKNEGK